MFIDSLFGSASVEMQHHTELPAEAPVVWRAVLDMDLGDSLLSRTLLRVRGLGASEHSWRALERVGFVKLIEVEPVELVYGLVAQPWRLSGNIHKVTAEEFVVFDTPGFARIVWNYRIDEADGGVRLTTTTRVRCTDDFSERRFRRYWRLIGPFSAVIRKRSLDSVRRRATADGS